MFLRALRDINKSFKEKNDMTSDKAYLTPLSRNVSAIIRNPLNTVGSAFLVAFLLVLSAFDFKCTFFALPIIVLELVSVITATSLAKHQKGGFGIGLCTTSAALGLTLSATLPIITLLEKYTDISVSYPEIFNVSFSDSALPLSLLNSGFDGVLYITLSLMLFFAARLIFACSLNLILKSNLKHTAGFLISSAVFVLSSALFTVCALDRIGVTSLLAKSKALGDIFVYIGLAVPVLGMVATALYLSLCIYTFIKMRKNNYAF